MRRVGGIDACDRERSVTGVSVADLRIAGRVSHFNRSADPPAGHRRINRPEARRSDFGRSGLQSEIRRIDDAGQRQVLGDPVEPSVDKDRQHVTRALQRPGLEEKRLPVPGRMLGQRVHDRCASDLADPPWDRVVERCGQADGEAAKSAPVQSSNGDQRRLGCGPSHIDERVEHGRAGGEHWVDVGIVWPEVAVGPDPTKEERRPLF